VGIGDIPLQSAAPARPVSRGIARSRARANHCRRAWLVLAVAGIEPLVYGRSGARLHHTIEVHESIVLRPSPTIVVRLLVTLGAFTFVVAACHDTDRASSDTVLEDLAGPAPVTPIPPKM
jgi:hypothetical protein